MYFKTVFVKQNLRFVLLLTICCSLLAGIGEDLFAKEFDFQFQRIVERDEPIELDLTYLEGNVEIVTSDDGRLVIDAIKRVKAVSLDEAEEVQGYIEIKVTQDENRILVQTNYLRMRNHRQSFWQKLFGRGGDESFGEVDWRIAVPEYSTVSITNTSGDITVDHLRGGVNIRSSAANISLSSIEGDVVIENSSGETTADLIFGSVSVRQSQGLIDLRWVQGDIKIRSVSAKIAVIQEYGSLDITTLTSVVEVQTSLESSGDFSVETESGDIKLKLPETASGKLRIISQSGKIKTEIPISIKSMTRKQVTGDFGFGGATISLSSVSGDVTVAQY